MKVLEIRDIILSKGEICDHCLGRQFTQLYQGVENSKIGAAIRIAKTEEDIAKLISKDLKVKLSKNCFICKGIFTEMEDMLEKMLEKASGLEWKSFLVGNKLPPELIESEEILWTDIGMQYCEPIKREINRLLGKRISEKTGKLADFENPDIILIANFKTKRAEINIRPLFIKGKYRKLVRGIPQTKWPCRYCKGIGCEKCNYTGKMYKESVEELIAHEILKATGGKESKFHGKGREDIDALMLGSGRDFIIEIIEPKKRYINLDEMLRKINDYAKGKVEVSDLSFSNKKEVIELKAATADKVYEAFVSSEESLSDEEVHKLELFFKNRKIKQRTPKRVAHRRADKIREKEIRYVKCQMINEKQFKAEIRAESGTYIKELISGDEGRTEPSFSSTINKKLSCEKLNVLELVDVED